MTVIPTQAISYISHPLATFGVFFAGLSDDLNTITIGQYETVYLQIRTVLLRLGDISGTRIIADNQFLYSLDMNVQMFHQTQDPVIC